MTYDRSPAYLHRRGRVKSAGFCYVSWRSGKIRTESYQGETLGFRLLGYWSVDAKLRNLWILVSYGFLGRDNNIEEGWVIFVFLTPEVTFAHVT